MTKIIISEDCGNSPKNILLQKLTIALAKVDTKFILSHVTDEIRWDIVGKKIIDGKEKVARELEALQADEELIIQHISSHGKVGAVNGKIKSKSGKTFGFCDVYEFSNAKGVAVKEITSYMIEVGQNL